MSSFPASMQDVRVQVDLQTTLPLLTPAQDFDGFHLWLRHESEFRLYAVSVQRRDGTVVIKKKCQCRTNECINADSLSPPYKIPSNGGVYVELKPVKKDYNPIPSGTWQRVWASAKNVTNNATAQAGVEITVSVPGQPTFSATDFGQSDVTWAENGRTFDEGSRAPILNALPVGMRGDNDNFLVDNFIVTQLP